MSGLHLGIRVNLNEFQRIHVEDVDFDSKIDTFKNYVSEKTNVHRDSLELVYCGNILEDDSTLTACGLKPGVMLHVLKKKPKEIPIPSQPMSEQDIKALVIAFRTLTLNPSHRHSLQKLSRPDILENIISITPGLSQDPVAISLIQDPELIVRLSANFDTVRRIVELHPALAEAANHIAATVHEEAIHSQIPGPSTSTGYNILDLLSDDEEMESSQSSDSVQPGVSRQPSFSAITPAQLAAALASASQGGAGAGSGSRTTDTSGSTITPEMVSEAMQRAMASVAPTSSSFSSSSLQEGRSNLSHANLREQMRQMRELGLTDDAVNLQALQLAGGNVHAAVDLVFSGAITADQTL
ncbi:unnamed protein product [Nezara viridula]|uniref:Ubiquitin-like protein 7 n=1 Tax=Nezara viridula TaxID=85310 RepID=A0A9P0H7A3_NEZVI|nr:unnamed protein product [Nezara viridula]